MNGKIMLNGKAYSSSGRPSREITMAQWLALPDTKYTDGVVYYIKDVGGANQFPPLIYSDEEREVGVWRDGKPIYEKTYTGSFVSSSSARTWHWILNTSQVADIHIDTLIDIFGNCKDSYGQTYPIPNILGTSGVVIGSGITLYDGFGICYQNFGSGTNYYSVTMRYTKTTDTAGAGTWTTDGTYAKHYSTEEKVIGTWIDGKPLYEKSYVTSQFSGGYDITTDIPFDGAFVVSGYYLLNDSNGSMIGLNEWFASANYSFCHVEKTTKKIQCYLMGYTGTGYFTIQYTKTTD